MELDSKNYPSMDKGIFQEDKNGGKSNSTAVIKPATILKDTFDSDNVVCGICGNAGYREMLSICSECNNEAEHLYCRQTLLDKIQRNWACEGCKLRKEDSLKRVILSSDSEDAESIPSNKCIDKQGNAGNHQSSGLSEKGNNTGGDTETGNCYLSSATSKKRLADCSIKLDSKPLTDQCVVSPLEESSFQARPVVSQDNSYESIDLRKANLLESVALNGLSSTDQNQSDSKASKNSPSAVTVLSAEKGCNIVIPIQSNIKQPSRSKLEKDESCQDHYVTRSPGLTSCRKKRTSSSPYSTIIVQDEPSFPLPSDILLSSVREATSNSCERPDAVHKTDLSISETITSTYGCPSGSGDESLLSTPKSLLVLPDGYKEKEHNGTVVIFRRPQKIAEKEKIEVSIPYVDSSVSLEFTEKYSGRKKVEDANSVKNQAVCESITQSSPCLITDEDKVYFDERREKHMHKPVEHRNFLMSKLSLVAKATQINTSLECENFQRLSSPRASVSLPHTIPEKTSLVPKKSHLVTGATCYHPQSLIFHSAVPEAGFLWRGTVVVTSNCIQVGSYGGMQAHLSTIAHPKVHENTKCLPPVLQVEELKRDLSNNTWPRLFQKKPPDVNSIGVFFFPSESYEEYQNLVARLASHDCALKVSLDSAELLIFSSKLLPEAHQQWMNQVYLWGLYRKKKTGSQAKPSLSPDSVKIFSMNVRPKGLEAKQSDSGRSVSDVVDMDVDSDNSEEHKAIKITQNADVIRTNMFKEDLLNCSMSIPFHASPAQPASPPKSCQLEEDTTKEFIPSACSLGIQQEIPSKFKNSEQVKGSISKTKPLELHQDCFLHSSKPKKREAALVFLEKTVSGVQEPTKEKCSEVNIPENRSTAGAPDDRILEVSSISQRLVDIQNCNHIQTDVLDLASGSRPVIMQPMIATANSGPSSPPWHASIESRDRLKSLHSHVDKSKRSRYHHEMDAKRLSCHVGKMERSKSHHEMDAKPSGCHAGKRERSKPYYEMDAKTLSCHVGKRNRSKPHLLMDANPSSCHVGKRDRSKLFNEMDAKASSCHVDNRQRSKLHCKMDAKPWSFHVDKRWRHKAHHQVDYSCDYDNKSEGGRYSCKVDDATPWSFHVDKRRHKSHHQIDYCSDYDNKSEGGRYRMQKHLGETEPRIFNIDWRVKEKSVNDTNERNECRFQKEQEIFHPQTRRKFETKFQVKDTQQKYQIGYEHPRPFTSLTLKPKIRSPSDKFSWNRKDFHPGERYDRQSHHKCQSSGSWVEDCQVGSKFAKRREKLSRSSSGFNNHEESEMLSEQGQINLNDEQCHEMQDNRNCILPQENAEVNTGAYAKESEAITGGKSLGFWSDVKNDIDQVPESIKECITGIKRKEITLDAALETHICVKDNCSPHAGGEIHYHQSVSNCLSVQSNTSLPLFPVIDMEEELELNNTLQEKSLWPEPEKPTSFEKSKRESRSCSLESQDTLHLTSRDAKSSNVQTCLTLALPDYRKQTHFCLEFQDDQQASGADHSITLSLGLGESVK